MSYTGNDWDEEPMTKLEEKLFFQTPTKLPVRHIRRRWYERFADRLIRALFGKTY